MAKRASMTDGLYNAIATWNEIVYDSGMHASSEQNLPSSEGSAITSDTFTAPDLTSVCLGCFAFLSDNASGQSITMHARLEYDSTGGGAWGDVGTESTLAKSNDDDSNQRYQLAFKGFNHTWLSTSANRYRVKFWRTSGGSNHDLRLTPATGNPAVRVLSDNADAVPVDNTDDITVASAISLNVDASPGSETVTNYAESGANAFGNFAIEICRGGSLKPDANDRTLSVNGICKAVDGGSLGCGTEGARYTDLFTIKHVGSRSNYPLMYTTSGGKWLSYGDDTLTNETREALIASGTGTAADPFILSEARSDWAVDDLLVIEPEANGEHEDRYIITVNSSTSFVLSDTQGGSELALPNERTSGVVKAINCRHNVFIDPNGNNVGILSYDSDSLGELRLNGVLQDGGFMDSLSDQAARFSGNVYGGSSVEFFAVIGYMLAYASVGGSNTAEGGLNLYSHGNTFEKLRCVGNRRQGIYRSTGYENTVRDYRGVGNNTVSSSSAADIRISGPGLLSILSGYIDCCEDAVFFMATSADILMQSLEVGANEPPTSLISLNSGYYTRLDFVHCTLDYGNLMDSSDTILNGIAGSYIGFHFCDTPDFTSNSETIRYTPGGTVSQTGKDGDGVDLDNTTVRTVGNNPTLYEPVNGLLDVLTIEQRKEEGVVFNSHIVTENFIAGDSVTIEMFKHNSAVANDSIVWTGTELNGDPDALGDWTTFSLVASNIVNEDTEAEVRITISSIQANAKVYMADDYNAQDSLSPSPGGRVWPKAKRSMVYPQALSENALALAFWKERILEGTDAELIAKYGDMSAAQSANATNEGVTNLQVAP